MVIPQTGGRIRVVIPDGLGPEIPLDYAWVIPWAVDATWLFEIVHSDGTPYDLDSCAFEFSFLLPDGSRFVREAVVTTPETGECETYTTQDDRFVLGVGQYPADGIFYAADGSRDEGVLPSRLIIAETVQQPGDLVSVPTFQQPLALGPRGYPRTLATYNGSTEYTYGDGVVHTANGATSSYMYINETASSGHAPPDSVYWILIASGAVAGVQTQPVSFGNWLAGDAIVFDTTRAAAGVLPAYCAMKNLVDPFDPSMGNVAIVGIALAPGTSGGTVQIAEGGVTLAPAITGLTGSDFGPITIDYITGRLRVLDPESSDTRYGYCDKNGNTYLLAAGFIG